MITQGGSNRKKDKHLFVEDDIMANQQIKEMPKPIIITNHNPKEIEIKSTYDFKSEVLRIKVKLIKEKGE